MLTSASSSTSVLAVAFFFVSALANAQVLQGHTQHKPLQGLTPKREYLTCEQTYGLGSVVCGNPATSHFCFDPSKGETCCHLDNGYCKLGDYCASVAGFCCHNGEDQLSCATRLNFPLLLPSSTVAISFPPPPITSTIVIAVAISSSDEATKILAATPTSAATDRGIENGSRTRSAITFTAPANLSIAAGRGGNSSIENLRSNRTGDFRFTGAAGSGRACGRIAGAALGLGVAVLGGLVVL